MSQRPSTRVGEDDRGRLRLLARIHRHYRTTMQDLAFGDLRLRLLRVADPESEFDRLHREARESNAAELKWQPYWVQNWESSLGLADVVSQEIMSGRSAMDLGCGLGLVAAVAAARGATVVAGDLAHSALLFARLNTWPWRRQVHVRRLDWRVDRLGRRFDRILGSDIVYEQREWPHLERFWSGHLVPQGELLLSEPRRTSARGLPAWLEGRGWRTESTELVIPDAPRIRLLRARRG